MQVSRQLSIWSIFKRFSVKLRIKPSPRLPQVIPIFLEPLDFFWSHFSFISIQVFLGLSSNYHTISNILLDSIAAVSNLWIISWNGSGMDQYGHLGCRVRGLGINKGFLFLLHQVITLHFHFMDRSCYGMSFQDFSLLVGFSIGQLWAIHRKRVIVLGSHGENFQQEMLRLT